MSLSQRIIKDLRYSSTIPPKVFTPCRRNHSAVYTGRKRPRDSSLAVQLHPKEYWFANSPTGEHELLHELRRAIQYCRPDEALAHLDSIITSGQSSLLTPIHVELIARSLRPNTDSEGKKDLPSYRDRMRKLRSILKHTKNLKSTGTYFLLLEETRILQSSRFVQSADPRDPSPEETWVDMIEDGIEPDAYCYHAYISASCSLPSSMRSLRLYKDGRKNEYRARQLQEAEVKVHQAVAMYHDMIRQNIVPSTMTIALLMLAFARCGNINALRSIILQTWNISIPASSSNVSAKQGTIDEHDEEDLDFDAQDCSSAANIATVSKDLALYPDQNLLKTLAMAFGACQENKLGLLAVQETARVYDLRVSEEVWTELLKWAYADASIKRSDTTHDDVEGIFQLAQKQYQIKPSIMMYDLAIKNHLASGRETSHAFTLMDQMLSSTECQRQGCNRDVNSLLRARIRIAREIADDNRGRLKAKLLHRIRQISMKVNEHKQCGNLERAAQLNDDLVNRTTYMIDVVSRWTKRINQFDSRIQDLLSSAQASHKKHTLRDTTKVEERLANTAIR